MVLVQPFVCVRKAGGPPGHELSLFSGRCRVNAECCAQAPWGMERQSTGGVEALAVPAAEGGGFKPTRGGLGAAGCEGCGGAGLSRCSLKAVPSSVPFPPSPLCLPPRLLAIVYRLIPPRPSHSSHNSHFPPSPLSALNSFPSPLRAESPLM
jgi:hypothetical protein